MTDPAWQHYRVERETDDVSRTTGPSAGDVAKELGKTMIVPRVPRFRPPRVARDVVKILDPAGNVVASFEFDTHSRSEEQEHRIVDDLLRLDVGAFRLKYGIST